MCPSISGCAPVSRVPQVIFNVLLGSSPRISVTIIYRDNLPFPKWARRLTSGFSRPSCKRIHWNKYDMYFSVIAIVHWVAKVASTTRNPRNRMMQLVVNTKKILTIQQAALFAYLFSFSSLKDKYCSPNFPGNIFNKTAIHKKNALENSRIF